MVDYFPEAWARTHALERGYVNDPRDPGGETNHGITVKVARSYGYLGEMRDLDETTALSIARRAYWQPLWLDQIAAIEPAIAFEVFDTNFNLWFGAAGKFLQRALNVLNRNGELYPELTPDGSIGPATIDALLKYLNARRAQRGVEVLLACLNAQQCVDYMRQCETNPGKETFFFGWIANRVLPPSG